MALDRADAALIKGMLARGGKQSDIAAFFGTNGVRVAEIDTGQRKAGASGKIAAARSLYGRETLEAVRDLINGAPGRIQRCHQSHRGHGPYGCSSRTRSPRRVERAKEEGFVCAGSPRPAP
jgi:hypothetical protein